MGDGGLLGRKRMREAEPEAGGCVVKKEKGEDCFIEGAPAAKRATKESPAALGDRTNHDQVMVNVPAITAEPHEHSALRSVAGESALDATRKSHAACVPQTQVGSQGIREEGSDLKDFPPTLKELKAATSAAMSRQIQFSYNFRLPNQQLLDAAILEQQQFETWAKVEHQSPGGAQGIANPEHAPNNAQQHYHHHRYQQQQQQQSFLEQEYWQQGHDQAADLNIQADYAGCSMPSRVSGGQFWQSTSYPDPQYHHAHGPFQNLGFSFQQHCLPFTEQQFAGQQSISQNHYHAGPPPLSGDDPLAQFLDDNWGPDDVANGPEGYGGGGRDKPMEA